MLASPLAGTPYNLCHTVLSTWLNEGMPPTDIAEWAGNSVEVLLRHVREVHGRSGDHHQEACGGSPRGTILPAASATRISGRIRDEQPMTTGNTWTQPDT